MLVWGLRGQADSLSGDVGPRPLQQPQRNLSLFGPLGSMACTRNLHLPNPDREESISYALFGHKLCPGLPSRTARIHRDGLAPGCSPNSCAAYLRQAPGALGRRGDVTWQLGYFFKSFGVGSGVGLFAGKPGLLSADLLKFGMPSRFLELVICQLKA